MAACVVFASDLPARGKDKPASGPSAKDSELREPTRAEAIAEIQRLGGSLNETDGRKARVRLNGPKVSDETLPLMRGLSDLRSLWAFGRTKITDDGLVHLKNLRDLTYLAFDGTDVTDEGLFHLRKLFNGRDFPMTWTVVSGTRRRAAFPVGPGSRESSRFRPPWRVPCSVVNPLRGQHFHGRRQLANADSIRRAFSNWPRFRSTRSASDWLNSRRAFPAGKKSFRTMQHHLNR